MNRSLVTTVALGAVVALLAASCGDDSESNSSGGQGGAAGAGGKASGGSSSGGSMSQGGSAGKGGGSGKGGTSAGGTNTGGTNAGGTNAAGAGGEPEGEGGAAGTGTGGEGGAAGSDGEVCEDVVDPVDPDCDDENVASIDFLSGRFGICGHWFGPNTGSDGWVVYGAPGAPSNTTFSVDVDTGLSWALIPGSYNQANGAVECANLTRGGSSDWRQATIDEARTLAAGCATTASGGSCTVSDDSCLATSCVAGAECESCPGGGQSTSPRADDLYCRPEVSICNEFHTSSTCSDCGTASSWTYGPVNGDLAPLEATTSISTVCVTTLPNGIPCFPIIQ